jgi:predicted dehydrogenase
MKPVSVALVGYGYWGPNLARNLHELPTAAFSTCCDLDENRLAQARARYPTIRTTTNYESLLDDPGIDAIVLATTAPTHYELTKLALAHGKHVLVEKPLTLESAHAQELIDLAQKQDRILMVGHVFEHNPAVWKMKELVDSGEIGMPYYAYSTRVNLGRVQSHLNALWSIAPHDISILIYLLGQMPSEVGAHGATYLNQNVEDVVFIHLVFPQRVTAHVHASWLDPSKVRRMTLVGSEKMIIYDDVASEGKIRVYDKGAYRKGDEIYGEFQYKLHTGDIYIPKIELSEPLRNECAHFVECIQEGRQPTTDGKNGLRVVRVLEAAQRSLEAGGVPQEIKP